MATAPAWPTLIKGNTGVNVKALQCLLNYRNGNEALTVDGSFGPAVYNAVVAYQQNKGLTVTGKADASTLSALVTPVKQGAVNKAVRAAQYLLSKFESLTIDGSFGPGCKTAVTSFQRKMGIDVDGSVGPVTWRYLFGYNTYPNDLILDPSGNMIQTLSAASSSNISLNYTLDTAKKWIYCNFPETFNLSHFGDGDLGNEVGGNHALNKVTVPAGEHQIFYSYNSCYNADSKLALPASFKFGIQVYNSNSTAAQLQILNSAHRDTPSNRSWFDAEVGAISDFYASSAQAAVTIPAKSSVWIWEKDILKSYIFTGLIRLTVSKQVYINAYVYKDRYKLTGNASAVPCNPSTNRMYSGLGDGCEYTASYTVLASALSTSKIQYFNLTSKKISGLKINGETKSSDLIPLKLAASTGRTSVSAESDDNLGNWCVPYTFSVTLKNDTSASKTIAGYLESLACQNTTYTDAEGIAVLRAWNQEKSCHYRNITNTTNNPNKVTTWQWFKQTLPANSSMTFTYTFVMGTNSGAGWRQIFKLV